MMTLEKAISIAALAHEGQTDKGGSHYIFHPLILMSTMDTEEEAILAVLHDVVEDSSITLEDLEKEGLSPRLLEALDLLTRKPRVSYQKYIEAIAENPLATKVKMADLSHNMDLSRLPKPTLSDFKKRQEYEKYQNYLVEHGAVEIVKTLPKEA